MKYKKNRVVPHSLVEARRLEVEGQLYTPPFPEDVEHWEDGSWSCSDASFKEMSSAYRRFGFTLERGSTFDELSEMFLFIQQVSGRLRGAGEWPMPHCTPTMIEYCLAVKARDDSKIPAALAAVMAEGGIVDPTEAPLPASPPVPKDTKLYVVK